MCCLLVDSFAYQMELGLGLELGSESGFGFGLGLGLGLGVSRIDLQPEDILSESIIVLRHLIHYLRMLNMCRSRHYLHLGNLSMVHMRKIVLRTTRNNGMY